MQKPYRFTERQNAMELLSNLLSEQNLSVDVISKAETGYEDTILKVGSCCSIEAEIRLVWSTNWWPDGENFEDGNVSIFVGDVIAHTVDVCAMLQMRHNKSLDEVISERVSNAIYEVLAACRTEV